MPQTTVMMLTWNRLTSIELTIKSLMSSQEDFDLIIFDNNSNPETINFLKNLKSKNHRIELILSNEYSTIWNSRWESAKRARTKYICTIDSDVYFPKKWLSKMLKLFKDPQVAQVGPLKSSRFLTSPYINRNLREEWINAQELSSDPLEQLDIYTHKHDFNIFVDDVVKLNHHNSLTVDNIEIPSRSISGCIMLMRRDLYLNWELNDSNYGRSNYGMDDVDLSWSLYYKGYKVKKCIDTYVHHFEHSSITENKIKKKRQSFYTGKENLLYFIGKWQKEIVTWLQDIDKNEFENNELIKIIKENLKINELPENLLSTINFLDEKFTQTY